MAASESSDQVSAAVAAAQEAANASAATAAAAAAAAFQRSTIEIWTLFAVGASVTMLRTYARIRAVGIKGLTADDYLVWVGVVRTRIILGYHGLQDSSNFLHVEGLLCRAICIGLERGQLSPWHGQQQYDQRRARRSFAR